MHRELTGGGSGGQGTRCHPSRHDQPGESRDRSANGGEQRRRRMHPAGHHMRGGTQGCGQQSEDAGLGSPRGGAHLTEPWAGHVPQAIPLTRHLATGNRSASRSRSHGCHGNSAATLKDVKISSAARRVSNRWPQRTVPILLAAGALLTLAACGGSKTQVPALTVHAVGSYGPVLTTASGQTLYLFAPDKRSTVTCHDECAGTWPPLFTASGKTATAGEGTRAALVGADADGSRRVATYGGWPLYRYLPDVPGEASGQAIDLNGGYWYVIRADGTPVVPAGDPPLAHA